MSKVARFSVSVDPELLQEFDELTEKMAVNRSSAVETAMRDFIADHRWTSGEGRIAGAITLLYDHHVRGLSEALTELQHRHIDAVTSVVHVHLEHRSCLEILAVSGQSSDVKALYTELEAVRGVQQIKFSAMEL